MEDEDNADSGVEAVDDAEAMAEENKDDDKEGEIRTRRKRQCRNYIFNYNS